MQFCPSVVLQTHYFNRIFENATMKNKSFAVTMKRDCHLLSHLDLKKEKHLILETQGFVSVLIHRF